MANNHIELLSALKDGEFTDDAFSKVLPSLCHDAEARKRWSRYHLIGEAMRNNLPTVLQHDLAQRVSAALHDEPTVLSPQPHKIPNLPKILKDRTATGYAVAASVAVVGFLTVGWVAQQLNPAAENVALTTPPNPAALAPLPQVASFANSAVVPAGALASAPAREGVLVAPSAAVAQAEQDNAEQLRSYLIDHEYMGSSVVRPMPLPGVRVVTFSAE
jgi:sigma-E factor negative regulatory protein RseA